MVDRSEVASQRSRRRKVYVVLAVIVGAVGCTGTSLICVKRGSFVRDDSASPSPNSTCAQPSTSKWNIARVARSMSISATTSCSCFNSACA